jgi:hypothetical protein
MDSNTPVDPGSYGHLAVQLWLFADVHQYLRHKVYTLSQISGINSTIGRLPNDLLFRNPLIDWVPNRACPLRDPGSGMTATGDLIAGFIPPKKKAPKQSLGSRNRTGIPSQVQNLIL